MSKTQHQKILTLMRTDPNRWWLPSDFMKPELGELFVGYEASARLSELAKANPDTIESQHQGKFIARRLKQATPRHDPTVEQPKAISWLNDE